MDKTVTFAVAGSGKTRSIVEKIVPGRRALVLTYTTNTEQDLCDRIALKFGSVPEGVSVMTYFSFLNRFCYKPFLQSTMHSRGISFAAPSRESMQFSLQNRARFIQGDRVYHCRMAKLLSVKGCVPELQRRLERYYDDVFVDEVQDFGGHDFNFLVELSAAKVSMGFVGDFYQHTFSTSHDGNVNQSLHTDYSAYLKKFSNAGFKVDTTSLSKSHRCSNEVCKHIVDSIGVPIASEESVVSTVRVVDSAADADRLHSDPSTVKLFMETHWRYDCYSHNWGACKGLDHYQDVCVVLNDKSWRQFAKGELVQAKPIIRNKLYVAFSRARGNLFIAPEKLFKKFLGRQ